jgi:hypothetical protein
MRVPVVRGIIARRILANYRVDPVVLAKMLPPPFRPKTINGFGIAGICLIRLKHIHPHFLPGDYGHSSENAAHRVAVEWTVDGQTHEGVYIPRRDSSSRLNTLVGGRLFPGVHHHARFDVYEADDAFRVALTSDDGQTRVRVAGQASAALPASSTFRSLPEASSFFEAGSLGYSATHRRGEYDGLELRSHAWQVEPLAVDAIESSFFDDPRLFPRSAIAFDCALLMRGIRHEWHGQASLRVPDAYEPSAA